MLIFRVLMRLLLFIGLSAVIALSSVMRMLRTACVGRRPVVDMLDVMCGELYHVAVIHIGNGATEIVVFDPVVVTVVEAVEKTAEQAVEKSAEQTAAENILKQAPGRGAASARNIYLRRVDVHGFDRLLFLFEHDST